MSNPMDTYTCHSRWCPFNLPAFNDTSRVAALCRNVTWTLKNFNSSEYQLLIDDNEWLIPACKLWCGEQSNQLLQLQVGGLSPRMAILIWFMVILLVVCVVIQLVFICLEWGARKVAMVGNPLFLAFVSLIVYFCMTEETDTIFYPIVGAMNVAAISYYFSSFQYSIGVTYELASGTALVFTMFPAWTLLTGDRIFAIVDFEINVALVREMVWVVLAMLTLSICWIIHSSIYRTVMYKATWIAAFNKQVREGRARGKDFMSGLWIQSGAQGHPTWRTPTGQSFGLYLTVLSWVIALKIHIYFTQGKYCKEDLILFHILLWVPPVVLTLAVLATQGFMCGKASCDIQGNLRSSFWECFMIDIESLLEYSALDVEEAMISYRLGRDTLEVENSNKVRKYKLSAFCWEMVDDAFLARCLYAIEAIYTVIALPGILVCKISRWLGICILRCTSHYAWLRWWQSSSRLKLSEKIKAYQIVRERCFEDTINIESGEVSDIYDRSRKASHDLQGPEIDEDFRNMLKNHRKDIKLSLVLDNIGPSCFSYLLERLVEVLNVETVLLERIVEVENGFTGDIEQKNRIA